MEQQRLDQAERVLALEQALFKELERQAFERVLVRLQEALTRAKSEFEVARGCTRAAADRLIDQNDDSQDLADSPLAADCA